MKKKDIKNHIRELEAPTITYQSPYGSIELSQGCEYIRTELSGQRFLDAIIKAQRDETIKKFQIQCWEIQNLKLKKGVILFATDGAKRLIYSDIIHYDTFALSEIKLWLISGVLCHIPRSVP